MDTDKQVTKDRLFMDIAIRLSQESRCAKKHVAAVAVKNKRIVGTGVNGTPSRTVNCDDHWKDDWLKTAPSLSFQEYTQLPGWREKHTAWSKIHEIHAEQNLIVEASRNLVSLEGTDIYVTLEPCADCAKLLAAIRPKRVIFQDPYLKGSPETRELLIACGIEVSCLGALL